MRRDTVLQCLLRAAEIGGAEDGIRFLDRRERETWFSFASLRDRAASVAGALHALGVRQGDRVAIIMPTRVEFLDVFFGAQWIGAVPTPLYPPVRLGRLDEYFERTTAMLHKASPVVVLHDDRVGRVIGRLLTSYTPALGMHDIGRLHAAEPIDPLPPGPDDLALVQFSSGTTSAPKPVALTHRQVVANADALLHRLLSEMATLPGGGDVVHAGVSWLPLYHDMGLIGGIVSAVHRPGPLTLIPPEVFLAKPAIWLRAISKYRATISPAPNFAFGLCLDRVSDEDMEGCDLSSWRMALNGAEPIAPERMNGFTERFSAWGFRPEALTPVYGLSEAALAVTFGSITTPFLCHSFDRELLRTGQAVRRSDGVNLASVGRPLDGFSVQIRGPDAAELPDGVVGRIWVHGPSVMSGYLDGQPAPIVDGWLDTGDLGFVDEGELYITGRAKDMIVIRGKNHAPQDLEAVLDQVPGVRTGCSAAVSEVSEQGERVLVFVEHRDKAAADLATRCAAAIRSATGISPDLVAVLAPGTLPRTSSGKIRRGETLRRFEADLLRPPETVGAWQLAGAMAKSTLTRMLHRYPPRG